MKTLYPQDFPQKLAEIPDPPEKLYLAGEIPRCDRYLAVVGSRKYTAYGRQMCESLMEGLAGSSICIVSGLALGIDAIAHKAALNVGLECLAVPGSGLDKSVLYPKTNQPLAENILKAGGGLVSEFAPDFKARAWGFPKRNRIMAGLSDAVLVIEATEKSGTLITARLAAEYSRDVFTVPGSLKSASTAGPHKLIRQGAALIRDADDIRKELHMEPLGDTDKDTDHLSDKEKRLIQAIDEPISKDELMASIDMPASQINILLSQMELKGLISESSGLIEKK